MTKLLFRKVSLMLLALFIAVGFSSCNSSENKELNKNKTLLDEADLYLEFGQMADARAKATDAIRNLNLLIAESPSDVSYLLLHARALITKFLIINSSIISNAPMQAKSLIRIPYPNDYLGYDKYIRVAMIDLKKAQEIGAPMKKEQSAALHAMLASVYRLKISTMSQANVQYKQAIKAYRSYLQELKMDKSSLGSRSFAISQVKNQIRLLSQSRAEVKLAMHKWEMALRILQKMMGGSDLSYFDLTFNQIETKMANLRTEASKEHERTPEKARAISDIVAKKRDPSTKAKELAGYSSYQINIMQSEIELASLKNNLMYRIICFHWLKKKKDLEQARIILRKYYPSLDSELNYLLKNS